MQKSERMEKALALADHCWANAQRMEPTFVGKYLEVAEKLLSEKPSVQGCDFKIACTKAGVMLPKSLHHNVWVSGPRFLEQIGWIKKGGKVEPTAGHNHMSTVTLWISTLYPAANDGTGFVAAAA